MNNQTSMSAQVDVLISLLEAFDTAVSLAVAISLRYNEVYTSEPNAANYTNVYSYSIDAQAVALVRKNPWCYTKNTNLSEKALAKFLEAESHNSITNRMYHHTRRDSLFNIAGRVRLKIFEILGTLPVLKFRGFGPGSSYEHRGEDSDLITKVTNPPGCTLSCRHHLLRLLYDTPHLAISMGLIERTHGDVTLTETQLPILEGNVFTTVPKDCRSDRPICIEPTGNMLLQKSLGYEIRKRLRLYGLDLDKRQDLHRWVLLEQGFADRSATIDLSSASDTISYEVVRDLLPPDWFGLLAACRSSKTQLPDGSWIRNEKFSSMGNGFTFELESLIFYAILLACRDVYGARDDFVSVFGDDIIAPLVWSNDLLRVLTDFGFMPNIDKTCVDGQFRESCGIDVFHGFNVRPVYVKDFNHICGDFTQLANIVSDIITNLDTQDPSLYRVWADIINKIPVRRRFWVTPEHRDGGIYRSFDALLLRGKLRSIGPNQYAVVKLDRCYKKKLIPPVPDQALLLSLLGVDSDGLVHRQSAYRLKPRIQPVSTAVSSVLFS